MNLNQIVDVVSEVTGINIKENTRKRSVVYARVIYYKIARDITPYSLSDIGEPLGKDHATVLFHLKNNFDVIESYEPKFYNFYLIAKDIAYKKVIKKIKDIPEPVQEKIEKHYLDVNKELLAKVEKLKEEIEFRKLLEDDERFLKYVKRVPKRNIHEFMERLNNLTNYMAKQ